MILAHPEADSGWHLASEGAAVHRAERTAVVADVHLGYEWARASAGDMVPPHSLGETIEKLERLLARAGIETLIVAGDLTESARPCRRTAADLQAFTSWLGSRGVALVVVRGNHDAPRRPPLPESIVIGGWTIGHGDRPFSGERTIRGHHHPALKAGGLVAPCFLVGPSAIVLPAFSLNAAGLDAELAARAAFPEAGAPGSSLRCVATLDGEVLDFGPVATLADRLRTART